jgi:hypothetical protein
MIPAHIGPCEFGRLGKLIAVRCPHEFDQVMRTVGGQWEAGGRRAQLDEVAAATSSEEHRHGSHRPRRPPAALGAAAAEARRARAG